MSEMERLSRAACPYVMQRSRMTRRARPALTAVLVVRVARMGEAHG